MFKASVIYNQPTDPQAFEDYYFSTHLPLAATVPHIARVETALALPNPDGSTPDVYRTATMWFEDAEKMQAALTSPECVAAIEDCGNFATGGLTLITEQVD